MNDDMKSFLNNEGATATTKIIFCLKKEFKWKTMLQTFKEKQNKQKINFKCLLLLQFESNILYQQTSFAQCPSTSCGRWLTLKKHFRNNFSIFFFLFFLCNQRFQSWITWNCHDNERKTKEHIHTHIHTIITTVPCNIHSFSFSLSLFVDHGKGKWKVLFIRVWEHVFNAQLNGCSYSF